MSFESAVAAGGEACTMVPCLCPRNAVQRASLLDSNVSKCAQSSTTVSAACVDWGTARVCGGEVEGLDLAERFA